jgi:hypothetical protein
MLITKNLSTNSIETLNLLNNKLEIKNKFYSEQIKEDINLSDILNIDETIDSNITKTSTID